MQEKWSIGLEWDLIEFLLDVYLTFTLGVTEKGDSAMAGATSGAHTTVNDNQKGWNRFVIYMLLLI